MIEVPLYAGPASLGPSGSFCTPLNSIGGCDPLALYLEAGPSVSRTCLGTADIAAALELITVSVSKYWLDLFVWVYFPSSSLLRSSLELSDPKVYAP